ncbi:putative TRAP transporter large permease protein [alpha proteobacterium Q-1]|nr:putative TRAP transporter large permease protein [alpha proteobacterium Q-1]
MSALIISITSLLILLLGAGLWVGLALLGTGIISLSLFRDLDVLAFLAGDLWRSLTSAELAALPLFILMGEILNRTRLAAQLFRGLSPFMTPLPGGLLHSNIVGCTLFAAVSGSSAATTATVGRITMRELEQRGYDRSLAMGSLCGAGTLGFLIPPSLVLIIYGVLAEVSILKLFLAGILPGLLLALGYMAWVALASVGKKQRPLKDSAPAMGRIKALFALLPVILLIGLVIGSLYLGLAGPSEAAIIGVAGALIIAAFHKALSFARLTEALMASIETSSMLGLILAGAFFLSKLAALFGLPTAAAAAVDALHLSPLGLISLLLLFYILLGMVLDGLSMIVMTLPLALPLVVGAGYDPLWFGIFLVIAVEMAQITPPIGFNLFVVQDLTGEPMGRIAAAAFPFFLMTAAMVFILVLFPDLVLWVL